MKCTHSHIRTGRCPNDATIEFRRAKVGIHARFFRRVCDGCFALIRRQIRERIVVRRLNEA